MSRLAVVMLLMCLPLWAGAQTAAEGAKFTVSVDGPVWVFFGDKASDRFWLRRYWRGTWDCSVASFSRDPAPGISKSCFVSGTDGYIAEGEKFTAPSGGVLFYGVGAKFRTRTLPLGSATWTCDSATMGGDPAYGVAKFCRATAYTDSLACWPKQLGGSGTWAAWGLVVSPTPTAWAGWLCEDKTVQAVGCVADGCKPDVFKRSVSSTDIKGANVALQGARTAHVDKGPVADLISSHWAEIVATRP
jgi:hypothetical protein